MHRFDFEATDCDGHRDLALSRRPSQYRTSMSELLIECGSSALVCLLPQCLCTLSSSHISPCQLMNCAHVFILVRDEVKCLISNMILLICLSLVSHSQHSSMDMVHNLTALITMSCIKSYIVSFHYGEETT